MSSTLPGYCLGDLKNSIRCPASSKIGKNVIIVENIWIKILKIREKQLVHLMHILPMKKMPIGCLSWIPTTKSVMKFYYVFKLTLSWLITFGTLNSNLVFWIGRIVGYHDVTKSSQKIFKMLKLVSKCYKFKIVFVIRIVQQIYFFLCRKLLVEMELYCNIFKKKSLPYHNICPRNVY